jgi:hypothetical protein
MLYQQRQIGVVKEEALAMAFCNTSLGCMQQFNSDPTRIKNHVEDMVSTTLAEERGI